MDVRVVLHLYGNRSSDFPEAADRPPSSWWAEKEGLIKLVLAYHLFKWLLVFTYQLNTTDPHSDSWGIGREGGTMQINLLISQQGDWNWNGSFVHFYSSLTWLDISGVHFHCRIVFPLEYLVAITTRNFHDVIFNVTLLVKQNRDKKNNMDMLETTWPGGRAGTKKNKKKKKNTTG